MAKIFIKKLTRKTIATQRGDADKYTIVDADGKYYDSWVAEFNRAWKEGDTLDVIDSQITSREYNGKTYFTIRSPFSGRTAGNATSPELLAKISTLETKLDELIGMVKNLGTDVTPF